ncbi:ATP-dependent helicase [[Limnothrix rosea] IAM M-220]|uniref:ATP-dependent helicase n=1 Tax=[Limnothrix rosea] IAM M-220 TaxID=454133 RepID=UPI0009595515|nr:ATP-dependent helicase [[Limnothrix rosea] IAM M-220]OKH17779.1 DNA helicase UvrD [[Limnothrix rosea] IAM M-220]
MNHLSSDQEAFLRGLMSGLRPGQIELAQWQAGAMAISAVPGSGKSHALAIAAVMTLARQQLHQQKQLVVVTFTRSAASSIKQKICAYLKAARLPAVGFTVQTLHGLALQIASRHPEVSGLDLERVTLTHTHASHPVMQEAVELWIQENEGLFQGLLAGKQEDQEETERLRRQFALRTEILPQLAQTVIHEAKSSNLQPAELAYLGDLRGDRYSLMTVAAGLYEKYQQLMCLRNLIDYDDMILGALRVLEVEELQDLWQTQIYGVFEDEAQDSSPLQEKLLSLLAGDRVAGKTNLVRVGDPNQAINSTFTPADPFYFNRFCEEVYCAEIQQAGRSSQTIITAANQLLSWAGGQSSPERRAYRLQDITPVAADDPQRNANPAPTGQGVEIEQPDNIYQTVELIGDRLEKLFTENPDHNAAILVRRHRQGKFIADILKERFRHSAFGMYEAQEGNNHSQIPAEIYAILRFLDRPHSPDCLRDALQVLGDRQQIATQDLSRLAAYPEKFLYPAPLDPLPDQPQILEAQALCDRLLQARWELPHHQLIPFLAMTLDYRATELATVQKLSEHIAQTVTDKKSLQQTLSILQELIRDGFKDIDEDSESVYTKKNQVTILTMHKSKGLDWDYVFVPFLHEDEISGAGWVPNAAKFLGDYTLAEVARAQIRQFVHRQEHTASRQNFSDAAAAWQEAQQLKQEEEYRLLYVAMTRAKRLLWLSAAKETAFSWSVFKPHQSSLKTKEMSRALQYLRAQQ